MTKNEAREKWLKKEITDQLDDYPQVIPEIFRDFVLSLIRNGYNEGYEAGQQSLKSDLEALTDQMLKMRGLLKDCIRILDASSEAEGIYFTDDQGEVEAKIREVLNE